MAGECRASGGTHQSRERLGANDACGRREDLMPPARQLTSSAHIKGKGSHQAPRCRGNLRFSAEDAHNKKMT